MVILIELESNDSRRSYAILSNGVILEDIRLFRFLLVCLFDFSC